MHAKYQPWQKPAQLGDHFWFQRPIQALISRNKYARGGAKFAGK
jgi:hypothetical protein